MHSVELSFGIACLPCPLLLALVSHLIIEEWFQLHCHLQYIIKLGARTSLDTGASIVTIIKLRHDLRRPACWLVSATDGSPSTSCHGNCQACGFCFHGDAISKDAITILDHTAASAASWDAESLIDADWPGTWVASQCDGCEDMLSLGRRAT
eukprot:4229776-Prymnesium_polylepis.2